MTTDQALQIGLMGANDTNSVIYAESLEESVIRNEWQELMQNVGFEAWGAFYRIRVINQEGCSKVYAIARLVAETYEVYGSTVTAEDGGWRVNGHHFVEIEDAFDSAAQSYRDISKRFLALNA